MRRRAVLAILIFGLLAVILSWQVSASNIMQTITAGKHEIPAAVGIEGVGGNIREKQPAKTGLTKIKEPINILLVGMDTGEFPGGAVREGVGRTDTIILVRLDPLKQSINMLSIPRDTLVEIPGRGSDKINHAHPFGGMSLTIKTVELFTGVKIDYYLKFDYRCFSEIVEVLGGVDVNVTEELHHKYYDFYPGTVRMNSAQAFVYLRLRNVPGGDITRTVRQQRFCIDLAREIRKTKNWVHIPELHEVVTKYGETDLSTLDILKIANTFRSIDLANISFNTVPGEDYMRRGVYYWKPDTEATTELMKSLFDTDRAGTRENE